MAVAKTKSDRLLQKTTLPVWLMFTPFSKTASKIYCRSFWKPRWMQLWAMKKSCKGDLKSDNKRNGHSPKSTQKPVRGIPDRCSRDRNGEFEPKLIPKYQRDISGIEEKVISLYARGMSTRVYS